MTTTKHRISSKIFVASIVAVIILSLLISPIMAITVTAATSSDASYSDEFKGYGEEKTNEEIHLLTRLTSPSEDAPSMTVLVHGQGGNASHWSNDDPWSNDPNWSKEKGVEFEYDSTSLIESLRTLYPNSDVFLADMITSTKFNLMKLNRGDYDETKRENIKQLNDVSKHIIVVFESLYSSASSYHRTIYEELHTVIDRISYDILYLTGKIPTINLISHSRGGLISMMYATGYREDGKLAHVQYQYSQTPIDGYIDIGDNYYEIPAEYNQNSNIINDHPYNVAELYSMGTPYHGTDWDEEILFGVSHSILGGAFSNESAKNILDETIQAEIHSCWEEAVKKNPNLNLNAIGGTFNLSFVLGLLSEDYDSLSGYLSANDLKAYLDILDEWGELAALTLTTIDAGLAYGTGKLITIPYVGWVLAVPAGALTITVGVADAVVITAVSRLNEFEAKYGEQLQSGTNIDQTIYTELSYVLKDFVDAFRTFGLFIGQFTGETNLVHEWGDLFIDTKSQFADGFSNVETYEKLFAYSDIDYAVEGDDVVVTYAFRTFNYKKTTGDPAIPHNLEARDSTIIHYICENIELGVPSTIYDYEVLSDNTVKITDVRLPDYYFDSDGKVIDKFKELKLSLMAGVAGKQVSYIEDYAFADFSNLAEITLPDSIETIGDQAFSNCVGLTGTFTLPNDLETLGEAVFYNCPNISAFSIVENDNFYVEKDALYSKNTYCTNDGLVYSIITETCGNTLVAYPGAKTETSFSVDDDVVNIANYAISGNQHIVYVALNNVKNIGKGAFEGASKLETITGVNVRYVGESAFEGTAWFNKTNDSGNKIIGKVLLKYTDSGVNFDTTGYISISANAFNGRDIENVIVGRDTRYIGANAFANCNELATITFLSLSEITQTDVDVFENCSEELVIYVPNSKTTQYKCYINLSDYAANIQPIVINVNFDTQGGSAVSPISVYYGDIVTLPSAQKAGYDFGGWKTNNSLVATGDAWEIYDSSVTLSAQWNPASYVITFNKQSGTGGTSTTVVNYKQPMPAGLTAPTRAGYTFGGYYSNTNGTGTQYYNASMVSVVSFYELTTATTLYAYWIPNEYEIVFDNQGGTGGTVSTVVTYGTSMPQAVAPQKSGYTFAGYFTGKNGTGTQYYSNTMNSSRNYNVTGATTLYAYWIIEEFEVVISAQEQWVEISSNQLELTNTQVTIPYGATANQTINVALIEAYLSYNGSRAGYELVGFYRSGDSSQALINWGNSIPDLGEDGDKITLEPKWEAKEYTITLNNQSGKIGSFGQSTSVSVSSYKSTDYAYIYFVPSSSGTITLWTSHTSGDPYLCLYNANKSLLASNDDGYGNLDSKITYSVVSGQSYYIGFRTFASTPCNGYVYYSGVTLSSSVAPTSYTVEFDSSMPTLIKPYRNGYTFGGYYTQPNGAGEQIYPASGSTQNTWGIAQNTTLYAYWMPNSYTVTLNKQSGTGGDASVSTVFGSSMTSATKPTRTGYTFEGYYTSPNGAGTKYYNSSMGSVRAYNIASNVTLYANWTPVTYTVTLNKNGGSSRQFAFSSTITSYNKEDIGYVYFVPSASGTITLWTTHTEGDPYLLLFDKNFVQLTSNDDGYGNLDSKITYTVTKGQSYYVGFRAYSGNKTTGTVNYSGVSVSSSSTYVKITYDDAPPSVLVPTKAGYSFDGYYTSTNGQGTKIYDKTGTKVTNWNTTNTTLYANWLATSYSYTGSTTTTISADTSIIDLSSATQSGTYVFTIATSVNEITFKSSLSRTFTNFRVIISNRTTPLVLRFEKVSIKAPAGYNAITASGNFRLTLAYSGTVSITGGKNATVGTGQGYAAIYNATSGATIALNGTGTLKLTGGVGSIGTVGATGSKGADGKDADGIFLENGTDGQNGGTGGKGGTGGTGGYAIYVTNIIVESTSGTITITGGEGGTGGKGGTGGEGGRGGHAAGSLVICRHGGDGGDGGAGGTGGTGGAGGVAYNGTLSKEYSSCITATATKGDQGTGGTGGRGGDGGDGGANGPSAFADGDHGVGGSGGAGGAGGTGSPNGFAGSSGSSGGYWYATL